jgi:hypothetical protein
LDWENTSVNLPASITNSGVFQIFFNFDTVDNSNNIYKGWFIDNVKIEHSNNLELLDVPNLVINCDEVNYNSSTTCRFALPIGKSLPSDVKIQIKDSALSPSCTLDTNPNNVICSNVATPNSVGVFPITLSIGVNSITTAYTARIKGVDFSKSEIVYTPNQGNESPIFKSSDNLNVKLLNYKNIFDPAPTGNSYVCIFDFSSLGANNWTTFGSNVAYDPISGCQAVFTKELRGNVLNFDLRYKICPSTDVNNQCSVFYDQYLYRFEGSGLAVGG